MHQQQHPIPHQSCDQDYEISILDILVVLAENIRLIIIFPLVIGLIALGISFLIPPTYQSVSWLALGEGDMNGMQSREVMEKVLEKTDWIHASTREAALKKLGSKLQISFNKKYNCLSITSEASTPQKAADLNALLINEYRAYSLPKGKALEGVNEKIRMLSDELSVLELVAKKISVNVEKVVPGTEGDNVARSYASINEKMPIVKQGLYGLRQTLLGFGAEVFIQHPTLPENPIKPKKAQFAIMMTIASGFLTILFVFIRAAFRNLSRDAEASEKIQRIRKGISLI
jgi:uncharacterized protein involved in exopolysaccharide biosynthesis